MNSGNRWSRSARAFALLLALVLLFAAGCVSIQPAETGAPEGSGPADGTALPAAEEQIPEPGGTGPETPEGTDRMFYAHVNGSVLPVLAADNPSADAFLALLAAGDVTVGMHDYGNFEKVGPLGTALPRSDEQITTEPGDVILYQGDQVTIYYDVNSWNFTRLGKVQGLSQAELKEILGSGDATVTFSLSAERQEPEARKTLVAVFSLTGNTKRLAEYAAEELDADLYEIRAKVPYTEEETRYGEDNRAYREQHDPSARPGIEGDLPDVSGYDTVLLGYPVWHLEAPKILYTFLDSTDLSGKRIIPFCTSTASPLGSSAENMHPLAPDSEWEEGMRFATEASKEEFLGWVRTLDIRTE